MLYVYVYAGRSLEFIFSVFLLKKPFVRALWSARLYIGTCGYQRINIYQSVDNRAHELGQGNSANTGSQRQADYNFPKCFYP